MYKHCKSTEDKDMTPLDFITDHLINIDGIFDKHDNEDEQKPQELRLNKRYTQPTGVELPFHTNLLPARRLERAASR